MSESASPDGLRRRRHRAARGASTSPTPHGGREVRRHRRPGLPQRRRLRARAAGRPGGRRSRRSPRRQPMRRVRRAQLRAAQQRAPSQVRRAAEAAEDAFASYARSRANVSGRGGSGCTGSGGRGQHGAAVLYASATTPRCGAAITSATTARSDKPTALPGRCGREVFRRVTVGYNGFIGVNTTSATTCASGARTGDRRRLANPGDTD